MGTDSECNNEVKRARTRSKQANGEKDDANTNSDIGCVQETVDEVCTKNRRNKKPAENQTEAGERQDKPAKKTRRGKRLKRKSLAQNSEADDPKRSKKDCDEGEEKESEELNDEEDPKKPKKPSKRQLKREKAEQRESMKKEASRLEATEKALNYVSKWKMARSEWKFEKLRQIWLIENLLDENAISDQMFPMVLEYFEGCKGMAREQLLKKGMDVIRKREETDETEENVESVEYKRARQLLQALPTES